MTFFNHRFRTNILNWRVFTIHILVPLVNYDDQKTTMTAEIEDVL